MSNRKWSREEIEYLKQNYLDMTNNQLAENLGRTTSAIKNRLNKEGLNRPDKYFYDKTFFEKIDTEEKAYWLGFIYADGWVSRNKGISYTLGIELNAKDYKHLQKFNKSLHGNIPVKFRERYDKRFNRNFNAAIIKVYSKKMYNDLIALGCTENKSKNLSMPFIPEKYFNHFLRGYFDGDGSVYLNKNRKCLNFTFSSSSLEFLTQIKEKLYQLHIYSYISNDFYNSPNNPIQAVAPKYQLHIKGMENTYIFSQYLYKDSSLFLDRKYEKVIEIIESNDIVNRINNYSGTKHK